MRASWICALVASLGAGALVGCSEQETAEELRSLAASEDAVFVCRDASGVGHPFSECPDYDGTDDADPSRRLSVYSLVSQTLTNEIAVIDVTAGQVVDIDKATPSFGFLRVGGRPVAMAASPGGMATFVTTSEVGHHGVFALPTSCIGAPEAGEPARDLTTWPACRLPSAPGEIAILVEPEIGGGGCEPHPDPAEPSSAGGCTTDLWQEAESTGRGRRKLVVSLPDEGKLVVLDAQDLLNEVPGAFRDCHVERELALEANIPPGITQQLPSDLQQSEECAERSVPLAPPPTQRRPQPAGFAVGDGRLYVADQSAPVIHVIDTGNVCQLSELPSLLPMSLREPERVVTTRKLAVSPLTPLGRRYLYAIDSEDQPGASVMAFDVSPDSVNPTPIVRPGSPEQPGEKPDRLSIGSSARDITFAYRDIPYVDESSGVAQFGTLCDPNPNVSASSPAALARPNLDFTSGARPGLLRGLFGFILLTNGSIAVVDVEDFDAACRRPEQTNSSSEPDFRGCAGDPEGVDFSPRNNERLVTGEVSCRVVEPHRFRRATFAINDSEVGVRAPSLRGFPQLTLPDFAAETSTLDRPRLLAVPFMAPSGPAPADVFVGSTRYTTNQGGEDALAVDPNSRASEQLQALNSVVLPPLEPRAYAAEDTVTVRYEGAFLDRRESGFLERNDASLVLSDSSLSFCNAGVYDVASMTDYAQRELGLDAEAAAAFGEAHADYVQITTEIPSESSSYWEAVGGGRAQFETCQRVFGDADVDNLDIKRDFKVRSASAGRLVLEPRAESAEVLENAEICFKSANKYRVRGGRQWIVTHGSSGFRHDVVESGADRSCIRSCSPLRKWAKGRVFEISSRTCHEPNAPMVDPLTERVGCAEPDEVACVYDQNANPANGAVPLDSPAAACIFDGLTARFALYRGREPSARDATFSWQTTGGYSPLVMSLTGISNTVSPQSIQFLPHPEVLAVVDGARHGLSLFSLDTFGLVRPSPFD